MQRTAGLVRTMVTVAHRKPLPWKDLAFEYKPCHYHVEFTHANGKWDDGVVKDRPFLDIPIMATVFHYGQCLFEGLKAFECQDKHVRYFQPGNDFNAKRMQRGCDRLMMPTVPTDVFNAAIKRAINANLEYVPPFGSEGSLYIRPFIFGSGARLGLGPSPEYKFLVFVNPVGPYYKDGVKGIDGIVIDKYDRCAPRGVGSVKAGGNYAADLVPAYEAKDKGYPIALYLDPLRHTFIEEFSTSNFIAITNDNKYVTPLSDSVLDSATNRVLEQVAKDMGLVTERRAIKFDEVANFREIGAVGTAVVVSPVSSLTRGQDVFKFPTHETLSALRQRVLEIQHGVYPDRHKWLHHID